VVFATELRMVMNYVDGKLVLLGDEVALGGNMYGVVVACLDEGQYSEGYGEQDWGYLEHGVLVNSSEAGIVYFARSSPNLTLIKRR